MSVLNEIILYGVAGGVAGAVGSMVFGHYTHKAALALKACEKFPKSDDARASVRLMSTVICNRMYALGFPAVNSDRNHDYTLLDTFGVEKDESIIRFFLMAHACGLEFKLQPREEGRKGGGVELEDGAVSSMREEWYAQKKDSFLDKLIKSIEVWLPKK